MEKVYLKHLYHVNFVLAVKRLMKEAAELKDPTDHYHAQPLEVSFCLCLLSFLFFTALNHYKCVWYALLVYFIPYIF